ncbi:MAG: beta-N-acetylhexosaminidase [Promethearchaeota archaeon]
MLNDDISIIPQPVKCVRKKGEVILDEDYIITVNEKAKRWGAYLANLLFPHLKLKVQEITISNTNTYEKSINLLINDRYKNLGNDGYVLDISDPSINVVANEEEGLFYGIQTFRQLLPLEIETRKILENLKIHLPCLEIEDYPRFKWRGFMLDEGRHFQGKEIVKKLLDIMALLKLNVFHWHLTDDQGWRIEIKRYPELTRMGSKRKGTQVGGFLSKKIKNVPHEGFYTQEDIKEIIAYAQEHFIKIIPEIDMPGHCMAALTTFPELSCSGGPFEVPQTFGIKKDVLCIGKEKVFQFVQNVLEEIIELFPSKIIHVGGDEVPTSRWKNCPDCQKRMIENNLKKEKQLQIYFSNRIMDFLNSKGCKTMGWNQILSKELKNDVIIQYWMGNKKTILENLRKGKKFVMSKFGYVYLDYNYKFTPLRKTYKYEPIPKKLEKSYHENVLGIEAPLWTEWIPNEGRLFWQAFPRLTAVAETAWSLKKNKNLESFKMRLEKFNQRLKFLGGGHARMNEIDPPFFKTMFGVFTIFKEPKGVADLL